MEVLRRRLHSAAVRASKRSYASGTHGKTGNQVHHFAGSSTEHGHHSAGPQVESLGTGFYVVLAAIPLAIGVYTVSRPSADGRLSGIGKLLEKYSDMQEKFAARNTLHTAMIEQAAFDRNLYQSNNGSTSINLRFPEIFNTGSPHNVVAGQGPRNMDQLVKHYEKLNEEAEAKKVEATR